MPIRVALVREATKGTELQGSTAHRVFTKAEIRCPTVVVVVASCCGYAFHQQRLGKWSGLRAK